MHFLRQNFWTVSNPILIGFGFQNIPALASLIKALNFSYKDKGN
jgi:hypothetical protein